MTVVRRKRSENFAIIPNHVAEDTRLSFEARGVLVYLLAKPHDWDIRITDLRKQGLGRDRAYRILDELAQAGYLERVQEAGPNGRFGATSYTVYDDPVPAQLPLPGKPEAARPLPENQDTATPLPENPHPEKPDTENQDALIRTQKNNKQFTKNPASEAFGALWQAWSDKVRPEDRSRAESMFFNLPAEIDRSSAIALSPLYRTIQVKRGKQSNLIGYLKTRAWRDLIDAPPTDKDGDFIITPDREEWQPWLDAVRASHGDVGVASTKRLGRMLRKDRWPPTCAPQMAMALG